MCRFCGNPECKADEMFDAAMEGKDNPLEALRELLGGGGMSEEEKAEYEKIKSETDYLQDEDLSDGQTGDRRFTSKIHRPTDGLHTYSSVDSATEVLGSSIDALNVAKVTGQTGDNEEAVEGFINMLEMFKKTMGEPVMSFCVTINKLSVDLRVLRNGETLNEMKFPNTKKFDDVMKLVSYTSEHFVDPLLADRDAIKEALGEEN